MTPRDRWLALLAGRRPDRVPTDLWCTPEVRTRLRADLGCPDDEAVARRLHIDRPRHLNGPPCRRAHHPDDPAANIWGVRYRTVDYGAGQYDEPVFHPLAAASTVAEIERFRIPEPADFDYGALDAELATGDGARIVRGGSYEPFLLACELRGLEQAYRDLRRAPALIEALLTRLFEFFYEHNRRIFEAGRGRIDLFYLAEDLGGQTGPLMSLDTYRRFLKPNQVRMADLARRHGVHVFYHTDGAARAFLPDLVRDVGIEVLNPIQWRCPGMDRAELVREFGRHVVFHGALDNQHTLPFGTPEDVRAEVRENLALFAGARWICAPCHNIQPNTPTANIVALYETMHECGRL